MTTPRFHLLVPVKDGRAAKTRLRAGSEARAALMAAFARDALTAACRVPLVEVHVVGDTKVLADLVDGLDVHLLPDEGEGDLNRALARAASRVASRDVGIAAMLADLPCLRTSELATALMHEGRGYVSDAGGTGTSLLLAPPGSALDPHFGRDSARRHAESGATPVAGDLVSLRLDVDTRTDLDRALRLGVGPHTTQVTTRLGIHPAS